LNGRFAGANAAIRPIQKIPVSVSEHLRADLLAMLLLWLRTAGAAV